MILVLAIINGYDPRNTENKTKIDKWKNINSYLT